MPSPLSQRDRLSGRTTKTQAARRRPRRLAPAVLEYLEPRTLLTLSATITGNTSTFVDSVVPLGGTLQVPSPVTPINANLTNNQFNVGTPGFVDAFDFDSVALGSNHLATATTSNVVLSVAGKAADYTFKVGPSSSPLLAGFQFIGGIQNNTMVLDYTNGDPIAGGGAVSFSAAGGTNVLQVIDPAGTYTTATYNVSTHKFLFGGQSIDVSAANLTLDLSATHITTLNVVLPSTANTLGLSRATAAPTSPDKLTIGSGSEINTLLYPTSVSPVTMTGGSATDTLTIDLGNGNPLPPDVGPGSGLFLSPTATTSVTYQNGSVTTAALDLATNILSLDGRQVHYPTLTPVDLSAIDVANVSLSYAAGHHDVILKQVVLPAQPNRPFRFYEGTTTLMTFPVVTGAASVFGFTGVANTLTVDYTNTNTIPDNPIPSLGGLFFDGAGSGTLTVTGTGSNANLQSVAYTATGPATGRLVIDNGTPTIPVVRTINFTGVDPVNVTTPSLGTLSVDITAVFSGATVTATAATAFPGDRVELNQGLASIYYTHPANLVLGATGGDVSNTYEYRLVGFSNNVTVNGNAGTMKVYAARDLASNPNTGTLTVFGGSGNATLNLDVSRGDPIPVPVPVPGVNRITFWGGSANNTLAVINPAPSGSPMAATNIRLHGSSPANWTELDFGNGKVNAYGLNKATDLTDSAGVTNALKVVFADTTNAIGLAISGGNSLISLNGADLVLFNKAKTSSVTLVGGSGCDTLIVDYTGGNPLPASFVFDDSAGGSCPGGVCGDGSGLTVINASGSVSVDASAAMQTVTVGGSTISLGNVSSVNLSGSSITDLTVNLPASSTEETLSVACANTVAKLKYNTSYALFYPLTTNPVTLTGGAASNTLTVDLGNGNPVPAGPDATRGLFVNLAGATTFQVVNGLVQLAELNVSAMTLAIDAGLVRFTTLPTPVDLTGAVIVSMQLDLAGNATLSRTTAPKQPLQFTQAGNPLLTFANSTPFVTVNGLAGANILTLDYVNGVPLPTANLSFIAEPGVQNVLVVSNATLTTAEYTVGGSGTNMLRLDSRLVTLVNPSKVSLDSSNTLANVIVDLANVANDVRLNSEPGGLNRIGLGANDLIAFKTPTNNATVNGGTQADTYTLSAGFAAPLVINDMSGGANNTLFVNFSGVSAGSPLPSTVTFHGSGSDTFAATGGPVQSAAYTATAPHAGTVAFVQSSQTTQLTFTGILDNTPGINLSSLGGLAALNLNVTDGVAHAYDLGGGYVRIDKGLAGVMFPTSGTNLALTAGPGDDRFNVNFLSLPSAGYSVNGGGGGDTMVVDSGATFLKETADSVSGRTGSIVDTSQTPTRSLQLTGSGVPTVIGLSFKVTNNHDSGLGSLRSAILNANTYSGNTIDSDNTYTIAPATPLPAITSKVTLNGGWMTLDGGKAIANGLQIDTGASYSTISGITLKNFANAGLYLNQASNVLIQGIVSYANGVGVLIVGSGSTGGGNSLTGNSFIGYNPNTTQSQAKPSPFGNVGHGVVIVGSTGNTIRGNTISGNGLAGVAVVNARGGGAPNLISNNVLGLSPNGRDQAGNLYGVLVENSNNTTVQGNQIGGNGRYGVYLLGSDAIQVTGNTVGDSLSTNPNADGNYARGNFGDGIFVSDSDNVLIAQNVIVGNAYPVRKKDQVFVNPNYPRPNSKRSYRQSFLANGIHLSGGKTRGTRIIGNRIGLTASGRTIPNQAFAILIDTGATFRLMTNNQFRTNPNYAPYTSVYDLTKLGLRA